MKRTLKEVQDCPEFLQHQGLTELAWLTHEAEWYDDDLTVIAIQNILTEKSRSENQVFLDEYRRLWPKHENAMRPGCVHTKPDIT